MERNVSHYNKLLSATERLPCLETKDNVGYVILQALIIFTNTPDGL